MNGSSPLARGLPLQGLVRVALRGIIPARAGFTRVFGDQWCGERDHPRSRGVYRPREITGQKEVGSSPLARGLLTFDNFPRAEFGIIPARAGFTLPHRLTCRQCRDHPRSRGVYGPVSPRMISLTGSSPLARGLQRLRRNVELDSRIIPARAGFTRGAPATPTAVPDHPRSRGVYSLPEIVTVPVVGSSPLARGLLHRGPQRYRRFRIIPARAGFT